MVSDLAAGIGRILPFAERTLDDVLYDEAELLDPLIKKLFDLIVEAATFICEYAKRSPTSMPICSDNLPELIYNRQAIKIPEIIGRSKDDQEPPKRLQDIGGRS